MTFYCAVAGMPYMTDCNDQPNWRQCAACKTDYAFGFDMEMKPIKPNYPVLAIYGDTDFILIEIGYWHWSDDDWNNFDAYDLNCRLLRL